MKTFLYLFKFQVSNWTKFCENDLPESARYLFSLPENRNPEQSENRSIPLILKKLEKELTTAKNIPNHRKYQGKGREKWISKLVSETFEGCYIKEFFSEYARNIVNGLQQAWSPYLIGFQMTVADLIAVSMVFQMLLKVLILPAIEFIFSDVVS